MVLHIWLKVPEKNLELFDLLLWLCIRSRSFILITDKIQVWV